MTFSDRGTQLRARKQTPESKGGIPASSDNGPARPPLRLVPGATQEVEPDPAPPADHAPSLGHVGGIKARFARHTVTSTHPPTFVDAAARLWLGRDEVRYGLAGQLAAVVAGLAQLLGLATCWVVAHLFFATKTQAALSAVVLIVGATVYAVAASH